MNINLLHRFFEGKTTAGEEKQIRTWFEASDENRNIFNRECLTHDLLLLVLPEVLNKQKKSRTFTPWMASTAVAMLLLLIVSVSYLFKTRGDAEQYSTILVPPGQRINHILPDNTEVWLNANTEFKYPGRFLGRTRTVYLNGEAYFDVSKNHRKPFIVKTLQGEVQVTGTSFNVEAYSKYGSFTTSLFTGSLDIFRNKVKLASLNPNQKSVLENNNLSISRITDMDVYLWKKGLIVFNDKKLPEILLSLEKYFDVEIRIDAIELPEHTYTGKFRQSDGIDYALRVLQKSIQFVYERDEETGTIFIKK